MEKKIWTMPQAEVMQFMAGEYCESACGTNNVIYNFTCDAGDGKPGVVWLETNNWIPEGATGNTLQKYDGSWIQKEDGSWGLEYKADELLGGYHACDIKHQASEKDDFSYGYYEYSYGASPNETAIVPVIIWQGDGDLHCTTNLNMSTWETAKS